jgi:glyoxylase-like metal-dependent hydrolase (beta-lactamase superfamily II)
MLVIPFFDPDTFTFTYLVANESRGEALVVDPVAGFDVASGQINYQAADRFLTVLTERSLKLRWILETHAHADHLSAAQYFKDQTGAEVVIGNGIAEVQQRFKGVYNLGDGFSTDGSQFDRLVADGDEIYLGDQRIRVMATPGHTSDSVTYVGDGFAFIGDTLFMPDYGTARCDFPGGDAGLLYESIQRIYALPKSTRLYMCHDYPPASVAESRSTNIHLRDGVSREEYIQLRQGRDATLAVPKLILPAIQVNICAGHLPAADDNGVSYLRLPLNADIGALASLDP